MPRQVASKDSAMSYPKTPKRYGSLFHRLCRRIFLNKVRTFETGCVEIHENDEVVRLGDLQSQQHVVIEVLDPRFYSRLLLGGTVGSGEAYMEGMWKCADLTSLIRIVIANGNLLEGLDKGLGRLLLPAYRFYHRRRKNTKLGSRENISAHYDLGNDFYATFLDSTMAYSAAVFATEDTDLEQASVAKFDRICRKLELRKTDHLLEIGTGWGGFALYAARNYGCRITTVTISREQYEYACMRIAEEGLEHQISVELKDYRDITGSFDKLVSIEMFEAVGHEYHDTFFSCCNMLLKPHGMLLLQSITIRDQVYESYLKEVDFIRRYIFPGGCVPSLTTITNSLSRVTDMKVFHLEDIGPHYAKTLSHWRDAFFTNIEKVRELAKSEQFIRMWEFYLCYCEAGFLERHLGDLQLLMVKPHARPVSLVQHLPRRS